MKELLQYAAESIVATGILYGCYRLLLDRRVDYGLCRAVLIGTLLLGALIPLVKIPVWPGRVIEIRPIADLPLPDEFLSAEPVTAPAPTFDERTILLLLYAAVVALLLGLMARQTVRIARLHRGAVVTRSGRYRLVRTLRQIASFAFLRSIYLWQQTPEEEVAAIVAHETSHIARHHTIERPVVEFLKALLWWNPFVWLTARSLVEVEEFEADLDVLRAGFRRDTYMTTIYRQLTGYSPDIANGLPHSLTKKRFQMMTTHIRKKGTLLRMAAVTPVLAGLVCAFSFTARATEYRMSELPAAGEPNTARPSVAPAEEQLGTLTVYAIGNGKALEGAIVKVQGTSRGTVTDREGKATLQIPADAVVEVFYIGMKSCAFSVWFDSAAKPSITKIVTLEPETAASRETTAEGAAGEPKLVYMVDGTIVSAEVFEAIDRDRIASIDVVAPVEPADGTASHRVIFVRLKSDGGPREEIDKVVVTGFAPRQEPANEAEPAETEDEELPFVVAEVMPKFQGGDLNAFRNWVNGQVRYPESAFGLKIPTCRVIASFVIDRSGNLTRIRILQSPDRSFSDEVVRVLLQSPRWEPGMQKGEKVAVNYTLPVEFRTTAPEAAGLTAESGSADESEEMPAVVEADRMPSFQGGNLDTFRQWLMRQVRYPEELLKREVMGTVVASFIVERDGRVAGIRIQRSPDRKLSEEVARVLSRSPRWSPGVQDGRTIRVSYTLPVQFYIRPQLPPQNK